MLTKNEISKINKSKRDVIISTEKLRLNLIINILLKKSLKISS